jgi:uncharacterized repeat protein (TIGR04076 family)
MPKVKLTVVKSNCRCGYCKAGDEYVIKDLCPPICHELWNSLYPNVYTLLNGGQLDYGNRKTSMFDCKCSDEDRVVIHGEAVPD